MPVQQIALAGGISAISRVVSCATSELNLGSARATVQIRAPDSL
jgi:hypothetical protein